jgi:hypothetical protein
MPRSATARAQTKGAQHPHAVENIDVARIFDEVADLLEIQGENHFERWPPDRFVLGAKPVLHCVAELVAALAKDLLRAVGDELLHAFDVVEHALYRVGSNLHGDSSSFIQAVLLTSGFTTRLAPATITKIATTGGFARHIWLMAAGARTRRVRQRNR